MRHSSVLNVTSNLSSAVTLQIGFSDGEGAADDAYARLSPRKRQVLRLIVLGHTNQQVAGLLDLSVKTVETYKSRLITKLGLVR